MCGEGGFSQIQSNTHTYIRVYIHIHSYIRKRIKIDKWVDLSKVHSSTYNFLGQRTGFSNLFPAFRYVMISALYIPGYGVLPSEKTSQQVIP